MLRLLKGQYEAARSLRFLLVGAANTVLAYGLYLLALKFASPVVSYLIALIAGTLFTSLFNIRAVFFETVTVAGLVIYAIYYLAYAGVSLALLWVAINEFGLNPAWAPIPVLAVMVPLHYLCSRLLIVGWQQKASG
jgi:putative flippase GtrA